MVETYFFFSWSSVSVCVHGLGSLLSMGGTWDMGHDGPDLTGVCVWHGSLFS